MAVLPAGSFNTSKRVYTAFKVGDVVEGGVEKVTRGLWSGNVGTLTSFFTSSAQSSTQKQYYYEIFDGISTSATSEAQFSITYGHNFGSGSLGQNEDSPSNAIYSQYAQILLPANQRVFTFNSVASQQVYALNINRARLKDRLDPGNFQLHLSTLNGDSFANNAHTGSNVSVNNSAKIISLIDDSGDNSDLDNDKGGPVPSYAWLILATGSILLTGFIGVFQYRGCKEEDVSSSDEDSDESSTDNSLVVEEHMSDSTVDFSDGKQSSNNSRRSLDAFFSNSLITDETPESKDEIEEDAETVVFSN